MLDANHKLILEDGSQIPNGKVIQIQISKTLTDTISRTKPLGRTTINQTTEPQVVKTTQRSMLDRFVLLLEDKKILHAVYA